MHRAQGQVGLVVDLDRGRCGALVPMGRGDPLAGVHVQAALVGDAAVPVVAAAVLESSTAASRARPIMWVDRLEVVRIGCSTGRCRVAGPRLGRRRHRSGRRPGRAITWAEPCPISVVPLSTSKRPSSTRRVTSTLLGVCIPLSITATPLPRLSPPWLPVDGGRRRRRAPGNGRRALSRPCRSGRRRRAGSASSSTRSTPSSAAIRSVTRSDAHTDWAAP